METDVTFRIRIGTEVIYDLFGWLVGLGNHDNAGKFFVNHLPQIANELVCLG